MTGLPELLLVGSGEQVWREYVLRTMAAGYRLHLFTPRRPSWEMRYLNGFTVVDTLDPAVMAKHVPAGTYAGSLTYEETRVEAHARLAAAAGHRASPPDAVAACRDKFAGREMLRRAGVPQARSVAVAGLDEARGRRTSRSG